MNDNIVGNVAQIEHLDGNIAQVDDYLSGNISQLDYLSGNLNSRGDEETVYRGYSAYEVALQQGFEGSKDEWLRALVGPQGETGVSISDVRLNEDYTLTVTLDDGTEFTTESIKGDKGDKGQKGDKGDKGDTGPAGATGPQGPQGQAGPKGDKGDTGEQGPKGDTGEKGQKGDTGQTGATGPQGPQGPQGETGAAFTYEDFTAAQLELLKGPQGQKGQKGQTGQTGPQGLKGDTGQKGEKGDTGPKGDTGQTGPEGKQGPQGPQGLKGDKGDKGDPGQPGTNMEIHICSITEYDSQTRVPTIVNPDSSTFYLVPSEDGTSPDLFTEWVYVNNAWEMFGNTTIDLSGYLTDVQINGISIVGDGVANIPKAADQKLGVVKPVVQYGTSVNHNGEIYIVSAYDALIKQGVQEYRPITPYYQDYATFYGLAKAAGADEKDSTLPVGQYTNEAKTSIQNMLDVPSKSDIPDVPVENVQIDGTSIVTDKVANIPIAKISKKGLIQIAPNFGININSIGDLYINGATSADCKNGGTNFGQYKPIVAARQHESTFYGLAKVAGHDEKNSTLPVGQYTDNAKDSIQIMLGVSPLIAPHESDPFESNHDVVGELFIINGKLYRAKTALTAGEYVNEGTNVEVVNISGVLDDTYVKNTDYASSNTAGVVKVDSDWGIGIYDPAWSGGGDYGNFLYISPPEPTQVKAGSSLYKAITPGLQHQSTFYGLAKAAGVDMASSSNAVGTYTDAAKTAIKNMLGVHDNFDSFAQTITGTDVTIVGQSSYRYNCGEVYSLDITPPSTGIIDVRFTSGSTPTVLTLPSTVKMPDWWTGIEANTIYEMCITDGVYCGVMTWAL